MEKACGNGSPGCSANRLLLRRDSYLDNFLGQDPADHRAHGGHLGEAVPGREDTWYEALWNGRAARRGPLNGTSARRR